MLDNLRKLRIIPPTEPDKDGSGEPVQLLSPTGGPLFFQPDPWTTIDNTSPIPPELGKLVTPNPTMAALVPPNSVGFGVKNFRMRYRREGSDYLHVEMTAGWDALPTMPAGVGNIIWLFQFPEGLRPISFSKVTNAVFVLNQSGLDSERRVGNVTVVPEGSGPDLSGLMAFAATPILATGEKLDIYADFLMAVSPR